MSDGGHTWRRYEAVLRGAGQNDTVFERIDRDRAISYWVSRFGVPEETFDEYAFYMKGKRKVWAVRRSVVEGLEGDTERETERLDSLKYETVGIPFVRLSGEFPKPTTDALQRFGGEATCNVVELNDEEAQSFAAGEDTEGTFEAERGYVIAHHIGTEAVLGCGLYLDDEGKEVLRSLVPKGRRVELLV